MKYQFKSFLQYTQLLHGISTKKSGSVKREDGQIDRTVIDKFAHNLGIVDDIICMKQIHSGTISIINNNKLLRIPDTDGLITDKKNIPLAVLTADCLPVFFYDPEKKVIGIAHAGYKGLLNHILENLINKVAVNFKSNPETILVGIGPCISRDCYEVGEELIGKFQREFPGFENIYTEREMKYYLDLLEIAQQCMLKEGILKEHIEVMNMCTLHDPNFYSYRGGDKEQRFAGIISLI